MSSNLGVYGEVFGVDRGQPVLGGVDHAVRHRAQGPLQRHLVLQHWGPGLVIVRADRRSLTVRSHVRLCVNSNVISREWELICVSNNDKMNIDIILYISAAQPTRDF